MSAVVVDTNVLLVADGQAGQLSLGCKSICIARLERAKAEEKIVLDHGRLILQEYGNKLNPSRRPPSPSSAFLKWLLVNQVNEQHVCLVELTPLDRERTRFREFPADSHLESSFDPSDRKFVSVAHAHPERPPILESADSKWIGWEAALNTHGIRLEILCRSELEKMWQKKSAGSK
jgi:hypothetical protein